MIKLEKEHKSFAFVTKARAVNLGDTYTDYMLTLLRLSFYCIGKSKNVFLDEFIKLCASNRKVISGHTTQAYLSIFQNVHDSLVVLHVFTFIFVQERIQRILIVKHYFSRRRYDQIRQGGGHEFGFQHSGRGFARGRRRENVQTFHFGGREFRFQFSQNQFQQQSRSWRRSREAETFASVFSLPFVLLTLSFFVYILLIVDKTQAYLDSDDEGQEEPFSRQPDDSEGEDRPERSKKLRSPQQQVMCNMGS